MLAFHKAHNAAATIAVMEVPMEEANRFGIMNTEDGDKIYEFEEKPESPKSNLASMGIYIFTWDRLRDALIEDNSIHPDSDFGKPSSLKCWMRDSPCMHGASMDTGRMSAPFSPIGSQYGFNPHPA